MNNILKIDDFLTRAFKRIENIFDEYDEIMYSFSGGKDSALSAHLLIRELNIRNERCRLGSQDPLDLKWFKKKLWCNIMHCEWIYTDVIEYTNEFCRENEYNTNFFYKCLPLGWSSSVTFGSDRLISWDKKSKNNWINNMPSHKECNCEIVTEDNILTGRCVLLKDLANVPGQELYNKWIGMDKNDNDLIPNYGLGSEPLSDGYNLWSFTGQDEDHEQETFSMWFCSQFRKNTKLCNIISIRSEESNDRRKILSQADPNTGKYGWIRNGNHQIDSLSPIYDLKTNHVWKSLIYQGFPYAKIYDKMYEANINPKHMRVASLLNIHGVHNLDYLKMIEPAIYNRINNRFNNVEFISSRSGYFKIGKPNKALWNGRNHIKAGYLKGRIKEISNQYKSILSKCLPDLQYKYQDGVFYDFILNGKKVFYPLENIKEDLYDLNLNELNQIEVSWKEYCLYLLNTTKNTNTRESWQEKMVTHMLKQRFQGIKSSWSAYFSLCILTDFCDKDIWGEEQALNNQQTLNKLNNECWNEEDWKLCAVHNKSKCPIIALSRYSHESLENECLNLIKYLIKNDRNKLLRLFEKSKWLNPLCNLWQNNIFHNSENIRILMQKEGVENVDDLDCFLSHDKINYDAINYESFSRGAYIMFKENIHSSGNYKRFASAILKNDITLRYLGFIPTYKERLSKKI